MPGKLDIIETGTDVTMILNADTANFHAGGNGQAGDIIISNKDGSPIFHVNSTNESLFLRTAPKAQQQFGDVTITLSGKDRTIILSDDGKDRITLSAKTGNLFLGGNGQDGDLFLYAGSITDNTDTDRASIHLDGDAGDIVLKNADCAEDFECLNADEAEPGTVVVLDTSGCVCVSSEAYDRKVAGVVSGAGEWKPGIVLDRRPAERNRLPIALVGKVYCRVDAGYGAIEAGDLLTTSPTRGHAMKAGDPLAAFGAVLGKALEPCVGGRGLLPILVALQ